MEEHTNLNSATFHDNQKVKKLRKVFKAHKGETHIIVLQDVPDPDAIASAATHQLICLSYGIEVDIVYSGQVSHRPERSLWEQGQWRLF